ncbi:hypothetical protein M2105_005681 [Paenibacillus sp. PastF-1]|nr:hypothetical protein [Paenibacillus sp. PastF-2]MDF9851224.1 hypothetical protein [Paenibacillus sp. PastM-2]MDF9857783.1 hypothetical protein [Paenibacillus sp. PastF-1]MDH6483073.1 hypothetical protein [Paenibacillus sp. PastH-2]MDH6510463.1 hypothetical protein [Paenibacillus sp. PastM-3]
MLYNSSIRALQHLEAGVNGGLIHDTYTGGNPSGGGADRLAA